MSFESLVMTMLQNGKITIIIIKAAEWDLPIFRKKLDLLETRFKPPAPPPKKKLSWKKFFFSFKKV